MLKSDLHLHTKEDTHCSGFVKHSAKELIDYAAELGFEIIAITNHDKVTYNKYLAEYAERKGMLLIPGAEIRINGKEVLVYNATQKDIEKIKTFADLRKLKNKQNMIIAPHPYFFLPQCLKKKVEEEIDLFDAIEYSHFYVNLINKNKKAAATAKRYKKPMIGTSDAHFLWQMNHTYSLIDSKKSIPAVINAVEQNNIKLITKPLPYAVFIRIILMTFYSGISKLLRMISLRFSKWHKK